MSLKNYIKIFIFVLGLFLAQPSLAVNWWVNNPSLCPADAYSQSCVGGQKVCGVNLSNVVSCADVSTFAAPVASTVTSGSVNANGGYLFDCYAQDAAAPYCDNNGGSTSGLYACFQKTACNTARVATVCTAGVWEAATCNTSVCLPGYRNCNADSDCSDVNEHDGDSCTATGGVPGTYSACTCNPISATLKLSFDSAIGTYLKNSTIANPALSIFSDGSLAFGATTQPTTTKFSVHDSNIFINDSVITSATPNAAITKNYLDSALSAYSSSNSMWQLSGNNLFASSTTWNVGIGTTNPTYKLEVNGAIKQGTGGIASYTGNVFSGEIRFYNGTTNTGGFYPSGGIFYIRSGSGDISFQAPTNTDRMYIQQSTGNVGIGTTTPSSALDIFGKAKITSAGTIYNTDSTRYLDMTGVLSDSLKVSGNIYTTAGLFKSDAAGTNYMLGSLGVGTTTAGTNKLYVNGTSYLNGASTINGIATVNSGLELATGGTRSVSYYGPVGNGYFTRMEQTSTAGFGTYGTVTGDWALYNRFTGANTRGWIWQLVTTNIASLNGQGGLQIAGNFNSQGTGNNYFAGNVGIGTTNPGAKLAVVGSTLNFDSAVATRHYRDVAFYSNSNPGVTGTMKITMPKLWSTTMLTVTIKGYNYSANGYWEVEVSGYNYNSPSWVNTTAEIKGKAPFSSVRLASDGTNNVILLGSTSTVWSYPKITVTDVIAGHANMDGWGSGWSIAPITDESTIVSSVSPTIPYIWNTSGGLGIGTTIPDAKLQVAGSFHVSGALNSVVLDKLTGTGNRIVMADASGSLYATSSSIATGLPVGTAGQTLRSDGTNWLANSVLYNNGTNIGIGTTSPSVKLHVVGDIIAGSAAGTRTQSFGGGGIAEYYGAEATPRWRIFRDSSIGSGTGNAITLGSAAIGQPGYASSILAFATGGVTNERMRIDATGNIGIGTTTPDSKLNVNGATHILGAFSSVVIDKLATDGAGTVMADASGALYTTQTSGLGRFRAVTAASTGNQGGYTGANARCNAVYTGSHVCTSAEMLNTINTGHTADIPNTTGIWISSGPPAYFANVNDCLGWTDNSAYGTIWIKNSADGYGSIGLCGGNGYPVACCK